MRQDNVSEINSNERLTLIDQILKKILDECEALSDLYCFENVVSDYLHKLKRNNPFIETEDIYGNRTYTSASSLVSEFISIPENVSALQTRYSKYKELLKECKNNIGKIVSGIDVSPDSYYTDYSAKTTLFCEVLRNFFENRFSINEIVLRELANDCLKDDNVALQVLPKIYPLENEYKYYTKAKVCELPYILHEISPASKDVYYTHCCVYAPRRCVRELLKSVKNIIDNNLYPFPPTEQIKDLPDILDRFLLYTGSISASYDFREVTYQNIVIFIDAKKKEDPKFPLNYPEWMKPEAREKLNYKELYEKTNEELRELKKDFGALQSEKEINPKNKRSWALMLGAFMKKCGLPEETFLTPPNLFFTTKINDKTLVNWVSEIHSIDDETIKAILEDVRRYTHNKHKKSYQSVKEFRKSASKK